MPPLLGHEQVFLACLRKDLPTNWQETSEDFLADCAKRANCPRDRLTAEVLYELPDCLLSREYRIFLETVTQGPEDYVGVAVTNVNDFNDAHGRGSVGAAIRHLQQFGHPCHYIRVCYDNQAPADPDEVHCVDFTRTNG